MVGSETKKMNAEEIGLEIERLRSELYGLRTQSVTEKVEDNSRLAKIKKDIARLHTERRARQLAEAK
jgi:large subunit ribosomal protein L29